jgi:hypothetical protein
MVGKLLDVLWSVDFLDGPGGLHVSMIWGDAGWWVLACRL